MKTKIKPIHYEILLTPDIVNSTFTGKVKIELDVLRPTDQIVLNATEIKILDASISINRIKSSLVAEYNASKEIINLKCSKTIATGKADLFIKFSGTLNDRLRGFYVSRYKDKNNKENKLASTQFEPTDARRAFPCWDEPDKKASFSLAVNIHQSHKAISNMPQKEETINPDGTKTIWFETTPIMSTYLLALIVGDINCIQRATESGTLVRIWAIDGSEEKGGYALDISIKILEYLEEYFGIKYPLPKLDHVAIPDFAAGAMENWGCITYREPALLFDSDSSSSSTRQLVAEIIAHEISHMWFGDLVTMKWWNDLWLNESFASWMGDKTINAIYPEWEKWTQFLVADTGNALRLDGLLTSHPIEQQVTNPDEIGQLFDAISYSKGASIIRMIESFLGENEFKDGIRKYLRKYQLNNASTNDLWECLEETSGKPVGEIMRTWIKATGYPFLTVNINRSKIISEISVSQKRFVYDENPPQSTDMEHVWPIPLTTIDNKCNSSVSLLDAKSQTIKLPKLSPQQWLKLNSGQTGFYRVLYNSNELKLLSAAIESKDLDPADRLGLISDTFAMTQARLSPASTFLDHCAAYITENSQPVWTELLYGLHTMQNLVYEQTCYKNYTRYCRQLLTNIYSDLGWKPRENDGHLTSLLRTQILSSLGQFEDQEILKTACGRFYDSLDNANKLPADLRKVIYALAAKQGTTDLYDIFWDMHGKSDLQEEKVRLLYAMTQFRDPVLIQKTLDSSLSNKVRTHETISVIVQTSSTHDGRKLAWKFIKENWKELNRRYGEGGFGLMYIIQSVSGFTDDESLSDIDEFFSLNPVPAAELALSQTKEKIKNNIQWIDYNKTDLCNWSYPNKD